MAAVTALVVIDALIALLTTASRASEGAARLRSLFAQAEAEGRPLTDEELRSCFQRGEAAWTRLEKVRRDLRPEEREEP